MPQGRLASIGPRSSDRGNHPIFRGKGRPLGCFNWAAILRSRKSPTSANSSGITALQLGRDPRSRKLESYGASPSRSSCFNWAAILGFAEDPSSSLRKRPTSSSFNWAAILRSRKSQRRTGLRLAVESFNWAAILEIRGNRPRRPRRRGRRRCFNWAAILRSRKYRSQRCGHDWPPRFNWAAILGSRKSVWWASDGLPQTASIGPRSSDRGNRPVLSFGTCWTGATIGPRSSDRGNLVTDIPLPRDIKLQLGRDPPDRGNDLPSLRCRGYACFNWAAILRSRKCAISPAAAARIRASIGPRSSDRGNERIGG